mmetsp:Transcript_65548/g.156738  ORF Transcript_65548/g.156738 Transcript_65548/m.156738 type:complete len:182 (+) Transcript_65548:1029-1574(+)
MPVASADLNVVLAATAVQLSTTASICPCTCTVGASVVTVEVDDCELGEVDDIEVDETVDGVVPVLAPVAKVPDMVEAVDFVVDVLLSVLPVVAVLGELVLLAEPLREVVLLTELPVLRPLPVVALLAWEVEAAITDVVASALPVLELPPAALVVPRSALLLASPLCDAAALLVLVTALEEA